MAELDDLFLDEEPAPSLAVPRKGRLQKGRSASPENKLPQRKKEKLGRKRPAAAARSESGSDSDAPIAAPSAKSKKKNTRPPPPSVSVSSGSASSADEEGAVARISARASPAQRAARRAARSLGGAAEPGGGGRYSDGLSGSGSGSEEASDSDPNSDFEKKKKKKGAGGGKGVQEGPGAKAARHSLPESLRLPPLRYPPPRPPPPLPAAAPQGAQKHSRSATADFSDGFKRRVVAHALQLSKSCRVKPTCNKFSMPGRTLYPPQLRRWLNDRGLMHDVFRALQGAGLSLADDVAAMLGAFGVDIPAPLPAPQAYASLTGALAGVQSICIHREPLHRQRACMPQRRGPPPGQRQARARG